MSNRRSSSRHQQASSGSSQRITNEQIIGLMSKLQQLLPELRNRSSRSDKVVSAPKVLQETCNYIRQLRKEVDDLSLRLTELLTTIDAEIVLRLL